MKLCAVVCLLGCGAAAAQEAAPIRVDVGLVNVGFSVRDAGGKLVTDLTRDEVEITEDGVPQKIAFFARSTDVPLNLGLIMDVSGSQQSFIKPHMHDLQSFLKTVLRPQDKAYLMAFGNRLTLVSDYTGSAKELVNSLEEFQKSAKSRDGISVRGPARAPPLGTAFYDAVFYGSTLMMQNIERGRRALILFSDGEDNSSAHHMLDAIEAAQSNDVQLFAIRYTEMQKRAVDGAQQIRHQRDGADRARNRRRDFDGQGHGLVESFRQIGEQLRSSYELAYHTSNPPGDQTFHKIVDSGASGQG